MTSPKYRHDGIYDEVDRSRYRANWPCLIWLILLAAVIIAAVWWWLNRG